MTSGTVTAGRPPGPDGSNRPEPLRSEAITSAILRPNSAVVPAGVCTDCCVGRVGTAILRLDALSSVTSTLSCAMAGVAKAAIVSAVVAASLFQWVIAIAFCRM